MTQFSASLDASSKIGVIQLTTDEDTLAINNPTGEKVQVWCQGNVDWYLDTISGEPASSRVLVVARQLFPIMLDQRSNNTFYVKGTAAGALVIWQPE